MVDLAAVQRCPTMSGSPSTRHDPGGVALERWRRAGLDELTGPEHGPGLGPPPGFVERLDDLCERIAATSGRSGRRVRLDGLTVLAERADLLGLRRRGRVSCGGACHLVRASDGWIAVSLSREVDWELLPAWIGAAVPRDGPDRWDEVHARCAELPTERIVGQGAILGLPVAALAEAVRDDQDDDPVRSGTLAAPAGESAVGGLRVVDLSSMWAGPLCGAVLAEAGAEVVKVESAQRPDGTRLGSPEHDRRLNGAKERRTIDLAQPSGLQQLRELLSRADLVIESTRPRALQQLGIRAEDLVAASHGPSVWVSITGHGRTGDLAHRVAPSKTRMSQTS